MYPYELFWGIDLYGIFMTVGFVAALLVFDTLAQKGDIPDKIRVFYMFTGIFSIGVGLFGASLVQSVFNYIKTGVFKWQGLTFYGGVIVGAAVFILITFFAGGLFFKEKEHLKYFGKVCEIAPCSITAAHA
ncbi:MAG: prolipoprotein diacylglyceryl transferase, partial [Clostridia bacterium]|nr:prolipoprotein diacylglyceryl transferase [Clostridia bacterium]